MTPERRFCSGQLARRHDEPFFCCVTGGGAAPYARVAYAYQWNNQAVHAGALYMRADVNPATGIAFDAGYQFMGGGTFALNHIRANVAYWYQNTYGATFGWQKTWGSLNPGYGTANGKPNSNAFIAEVDWVPFGKAESYANPWANLKVGAQYIAYTQFDGGYSNYDGNGRGAGANNTFLLFAWLTF